MAENKKIIRIETADIGNVANKQIAVMSGNDDDLGFRMWGGKDGNGDVTYWLAKGKPGSLTTLTLTGPTTITNPGILQYDAAGDVTGGAEIDLLDNVNISTPTNGQGLKYNSGTGDWENANIDASSITLDDCYDNDSGERTVNVDAGDIRFDMSSTYSIVLDMIHTTQNGVDGFQVIDTSDYFKILKSSATDTLDLSAVLQVGSIVTANDLTFGARSGSTITLNESGQESLAVGFTATSIIGALNELEGGSGSGSLDDAYDNDSGERLITVNDGDVTWDVNGAYSFNVDLTGVPADGLDGFQVYDDSDYFKILRPSPPASLELLAELELIDINSSNKIQLDAVLSSNFSVSGAGSDLTLSSLSASIVINPSNITIDGDLITTSDADIVAAPHGTGVFKVATPEYISFDHNQTDGLVGLSKGGHITNHVAPVSLNDDASFNLPDASSGFGFFMLGDNEEYAFISWGSDGAATLISNSTNVATTDSDGDLCFVDSGTQVQVKNRLGSAKEIMFDYHYTT